VPPPLGSPEFCYKTRSGLVHGSQFLSETVRLTDTEVHLYDRLEETLRKVLLRAFETEPSRQTSGTRKQLRHSYPCLLQAKFRKLRRRLDRSLDVVKARRLNDCAIDVDFMRQTGLVLLEDRFLKVPVPSDA